MAPPPPVLPVLLLLAAAAALPALGLRAAAWELRVPGGARAFALGPGRTYAVGAAQTPRELLDVGREGRLAGRRRVSGAGPRGCMHLAGRPLPLQVRLAARGAPTALSLRLRPRAHHPGCRARARRARAVLPGPGLCGALCFPVPGGCAAAQRSVLAVPTTIPACSCPPRPGPRCPGRPICLCLLCALRCAAGAVRVGLALEAAASGTPSASPSPSPPSNLPQTRAGPVRRARRGTSGRGSLKFPMPNYQVALFENEPAGTPLLQLHAHYTIEGEEERVSYYMEGLFDERSRGYFRIDSATGAVSTASELDRETKETHVLRVKAVDYSTPPRSATTYITVLVKDTNDHSPVFEQSEYRERVRENLEVGYEVLTIRASDRDSPVNANMRYRMLGGAWDVFQLNASSGVVSTRAVLDREEAAEYQLLVEASDQGRNPGPLSATATVYIEVEDENDNYPQFSEQNYVVQVPEDVGLNTAVLRVQATDRDQGQNAAIHYSILSGNVAGQFYLHSLSGILDVINPLDFEDVQKYSLSIKAQDGGRPPLINSSGVVSVQVLDVNDNEPIFVSSPFQATVLENVPLGYSVVHIQAVDADSGENARLHYRLVDTASAFLGGGSAGPKNPVPAPDFPFQIHNSSGWITLCAELDREEVEHYSFGVEAVDHGSPPMSSSTSVSITVLDVNDNDPVFTQPTYELRLNEDAAVGSSVLTLQARDRDANSVITYQLTGGNTRNRFALSSQRGGGLITLALPLDYKQEQQYVLAVTASDGTRSHTAHVLINVTDANTHRPVFQSSHYTVSVSEDRPVGTSIATLSANDEDTGENARITYVIQDPVPQFRIDPDSGIMYTMMELDYEQQVAYTLTIMALDNGIPQKSDTTTLEILILDANDNAPQFLWDFYQGSIFEDAPPSTSILQVSATDRDSGPNGRLLYTFQGGDDGDGDFYIEPTSGVIRTQRRLDRENVAVYNLWAVAVDRGSPTALSASVEVQVTILDINDNAPMFEKDELELFVEENNPVGSVVAKIRAQDPDEGPNAQIMYQIVEGDMRHFFQLDLLNGDLRALVELDFEVRREYVLVVQATSAPLVSRATVHILLVDQNDNPPVLPDFQILFNNYVTNKSNSFPTGVIGRIPAHDPDVSDSLNYTFLRGNELHLLLLDPATGELQLSRDLDNNRPLEALMEVSVSDGIHSVTALCTLRVTIITDDMLTNSITVRLENMSQEKFLSPLLALFVEGVAAVLSTSKEDVFVFNVQNDTDVSANILNVTFSALLPGGVRGQFFPSEDLQEQIYLNRTLLTTISTQRVLPFDDNICLREPCENYMKCVSVLRFDSSAPFLSSTTVLFRPIHPINGLRCRCPPGFTGDYCETEIDLCYSSPCGAHGRCRSREGGYTCECFEDFTGEHCEVDARSGRCANGVCKNGGTCVNLLIGGFHCVCPPGEYERPYCEVTTRSFPPRSFVTFRGLRQRFHFTVSLTFATQERNGLLLYNGRFNEKHDFIALEVVDEQVQLTFSAGETTTTVAPKVPGGVSDGQWHLVQVQYYNKPNIGHLGLPHGPSGEKMAVVTVDDCDTTMAVRFGNDIGNYSCAAQGTQTGSKKSLDLTGPLLLGGVPNLPEDFPVHNRQFVGCMRNLSVDGKNVDMAGFIANNGTREGCAARRNFCDGRRCQNGGTCVNRWNMYLCECPLQFGGKNCEQAMPHLQLFSGESIVSWSDLNVIISVPWYLGLMFRTRKEDSILMEATSGGSTSFRLQILNSHLQFEVSHGPSGVESMVLSGLRVTDGEWHHLLIELKNVKEDSEMKHLVTMTLDYGMDQSRADIGGMLPGLTIRSMVVGGASEDKVSVRRGFRGCMQGVRMGGTPTNVATLNMNNALKVRVKDGCDVEDPCTSSPCPPHSRCHNAWEDYSCICDKVLAVDIFDKFNFTGATVPRFSAIQEEFPRELQSSISFPADFFKPPEEKEGPLGRPAGRRTTPQTTRPGPSTEREAPISRRRRHPDDAGQFAVTLVIIYRTLGQFLPERYDPDRRSLRLPHRPVINTPMVSTLVYSEGALLPRPLERPVLVEFALLETEERTKPICVFWNHSLAVSGTGGWSARGCELLSRNRTHVACQCSHTASFAVLMDISRRENGEVLPLKIVTYAAVSLSLAALLVAFVLLSLVRTLCSNLHSIHKHLAAALFLSQLVFVMGINQTENPFLCTVVAILLHFIYMSTFAWTLVESLHVYRVLTEVRNIDAGPMRFYYVVGWGLPAIVTGLAVGLDPQGYGNPDFCWLSLQDTLIWSFAGPVGAVMIINTVIFVLSAKVSCQRKHHYYEKKGIVSLLRTAFLLLLLISATWLLGLLAVNRDALSFHYLFAVFSGLQGPCVLLFHCVLSQEVRKHLKGVLSGRKLHLEESATTRAMLLTRSLNCNTTFGDGPDMLRTALGESTASLDSTIRDEGIQKLSMSSGQARGSHGEPDSSFLPKGSKDPSGHDSDSDSELSLDEQSSSYASSHSSDSEDDGVGAEEKWDPARGAIHSTPKGDAMVNHVPAIWPNQSLGGSDSEDPEDPGSQPRLKVETKVSVELHLEEQGGHCGERPPDRESGGTVRPASSQPPEQRKGILKNKVTYPPPLTLTEQMLKGRLREKLAHCEQSPASSRTSSLGSGGPDGAIMVKSPGREPGREHLNGAAMNVRVGSTQADGSDSEGSNETSI
ncbi:cadherin EGF LAG seven-pass G-type receptor 1 isoform X5 [Cebus imitator]|uniref:cadherin EGF LAG seven-pass G-type receptor 1 isoform X5 n=1 Tax=Cebus imitator TaxID=2715852 RepID=UPI00080A1EED|nr:cadherin EGF LAG seven-pass G-type receptor 1 isoform X5 [Cebus imitator]